MKCEQDQFLSNADDIEGKRAQSHNIKSYRYKVYLLILIGISMLFNCCNTVSPEIKNEIKLKEIDVSAEEAYLQIKLKTNYNDKKVQLYKDGEKYLEYFASTIDTVITCLGLKENTSYTFQCKLVENEDKVLISNEINTTTLGITSHEFDWKFFTFSAYSTNLLNDVCVVSENDIWAVGNVALLDSDGVEIQKKYNALNWDGKKWNENRLEVYINYMDVGYTTSASYGNSIFEAEDGTLVFLSSSGGVSVKKDDQWQYITVPNGVEQPYSCRNAFAIDETEIYFCNIYGELFTYKNNNWFKEQTPVEMIIKFFGFYNETSNSYQMIFSDNSNVFTLDRNNLIKEFKWINEDNALGFWTNNGYPMYISGFQVYKGNQGNFTRIEEIDADGFQNIQGTALNNIIAVSVLGWIYHYNGETWAKNGVLLDKGVYVRNISFNNGILAVCGIHGNNAFVLLGKQN